MQIRLSGNRHVVLVFAYHERLLPRGMKQRATMARVECYKGDELLYRGHGVVYHHSADRYSKFAGRKRALAKVLQSWPLSDRLSKADRRAIWRDVLAVWRWPGKRRAQLTRMIREFVATASDPTPVGLRESLTGEWPFREFVDETKAIFLRGEIEWERVDGRDIIRKGRNW